MQLLFTTFFTCLIFTGYAQNEWGSQWKFFTNTFTFDKEYNQKNKLKSNFVRAVAVDENGAVWIADADELKYYFNNKMRTLKTKDYGNPRSVNSIKIDGQQNVWVGTNKGLYKYTSGGFQYIEVPNIKNVTEIGIDKKDNIYVAGFKSDGIGAQGGGLSVFNGNEWKNYNQKNSDIPRKFVEDIAFDKDGNVWMSVGTNDAGISRFDGEKWSSFNKENSGLTSNTVRAIDFDSQGNAWFCTPKGLVKFDGKNWTVKSMKDLLYGSKFSALTKWVDEPDLLSIAIDENDVAWIGTEGSGVIRIQGESKILINKDNSPITSDYVRKIYVDKLNRKWFLTGFYPENWSDRYFKELEGAATRFVGVVMYKDPNYKIYPEWEILNTFTSDQPGNFFTEIKADKNGAMWLASGVGVVEKNDQGWKVYNYPEKGIAGEMIHCITIGETGKIYAGAQMNGLFQVYGDELKHYSKESMGFDSKNLVDVLIDDEDNLWIAHIKGVDRCGADGCNLYNKKNGLLSNNIFSLYADSKGRVWVCHTKGVSIYDHGTWTSYDKKANGLAGYIYDVIEDNDGNFWAGGSKGLYKLDGDKWTIVPPVGDMPTNPNIKCLAIDKNGKLWMGSHTRGVFTYNGKSWKHYDWENSGILFGKVWDIEIAANGDVWICLEKGGTIASSSSYTTSGAATSPAPDPGYELKQKINKFDPSAAIVIFKGN